MALTPLKEEDPLLRQPSAALTKKLLHSHEQQLEIDTLLDFVYGATGGPRAVEQETLSRPRTVGLSAPQVGIMKRICIVDLAIGMRGYHDIYVLVNPEIKWHSTATIERAEGCVNFPTTWGLAHRWKSIKVAAWDRSGNEIQLKLTGWPAVLVQHEVDHLDGYLFIDRLTDPEHALKVLKKDYESYQKTKPEDWDKYIDVSKRVRPLKW